jgi:uncharacterized membrane protein YdcZ (DUF606 family)
MKAILFSLILGVLAVLQGGLNRQFSGKFSLAHAFLVNSIVLLSIAVVFWFISQKSGSIAAEFKWQWWFLIPGICGAGLVLGIPWAIPQIGALQVFLCLVVSQMIASTIWDSVVENRQPDAFRICGAGLAIVGLIVANWKEIA